MSKARVEKGLLPSDVLPAGDDARIAYADKLKLDLQRYSFADGHQAMVIGQILHDMQRQDLWRYYADSWSEFVNDVGLTSATEFQRRKNYEFFVLQLGLDPSDERLAQAAGSKLALATRQKHRAWVSENLDEFLDLARLPLGEGGLTRADLNRYMEEQVGLAEADEDSDTRRTLRSLRKAVVQYSSLPDDSRDVLAQAVRDDDDIYDNLRNLIDYAGKKQSYTAPPTEEVDVEVEEW